MARKVKDERPDASAPEFFPNDLWAAPRYSLKGPRGERAWENRLGGPPSSNRFLELADVALGLKKPSRKKQS